MVVKAVKSSVVTDIIKSPLDKKEYRYLSLENKLTVLLIHDPEINKDIVNTKRDHKAGEHSDEESVDMMEDEDEDEEDESMDEDEGEDADEDEDMTDDSEDEGEDDEDEEGGGRRKGSSHGAVKKAAAAMSVGIGSLSDPLVMQGLSHYLEHMLFMGSKKYPDENDYDEFITKHGGSSNAYTELEFTNFYFEVAPEHLHGALDRFSQFFIAPMFNAGSLEREVLAVDSEFSGVQQDDACRISQLICHTARDGHPYRKFSWGNKKSLWDQPLAQGLDIRQHIMDYYNKHYTAERMNLVLLGGEPLDTLQTWVEELFADLPAGKGDRPNFKDMPFPFKGRSLYVVPAVKDHHEVSLTFQLPCMFQHYACKAEHYVSHLLGHEGPGSLLSYLKARGWASEVCAGIEEDGYSQNTGFFLMTITITLTEAGLVAGPGCGLAPVGAAFQYLRMLREAGPQEWVWKEMAGISDMKFRFQEEEEPSDMVARHAAGMHLVKPQHVLAAEYLHDKYDPQLIRQVLDALHPTATEYRIDLLSKLYPELKIKLQELVQGQATTDTEPWFNMEATWAQIPEEMCESWSATAPAKELHLPPPNPYIATDFALKAAQLLKSKTVDVKTASEQEIVAAAAAEETSEAAELAAKHGLPVVLSTPPVMVHNAPGLRVWHKLDRSFGVPKANVYFRLSSPEWCACPRTAALTAMSLKLLEDALTEDAYLADVAGLHYSTAPEGLTGVELKVDGYTHKLPIMAERLFAMLCDATFQAAAFPSVKEAQQRKYRNFNMQVSKHANYERLYVLCARALHYTRLQPEIDAAEQSHVTEHVRKALSNCHMEVFAHGNMTSQEAVSLATRTQAVLQKTGAAVAAGSPGCSMAPEDRDRDRCVSLPIGQSVVVQQPAKNEGEENCGVEIYYQVAPASSAADRALLDLVDQIVYEPAYNQLRTKQQLGYTVHTGSRLTHGVLGFCFVVVSASHTAQQVDDSVEAFIESYSKTLSEMSEEEFQQQKSSLAANKLSRDRALADESVRHWDHIWNQRYDFLGREAEVAALDNITLQQVQQWWATYLAASSPQRRKLAVHIVPTKPCPASGHPSTEQKGVANGTSREGHADGAHNGSAALPVGPKQEKDRLVLKTMTEIDAFKSKAEKYALTLREPPPKDITIH